MEKHGGIFNANSVLGLPTSFDDDEPARNEPTSNPADFIGSPSQQPPIPYMPQAPTFGPAIPYIPPIPNIPFALSNVGGQQPTPWAKYGLIAGAVVAAGLGLWWWSGRSPSIPTSVPTGRLRPVGTIE